MSVLPEAKLSRRVAGYHDLRLDGIGDLLYRASGMRVMDIGCNRGLAGFELANNGAALVHGCDNYVEGITTARHLFADLRSVDSRFEVVDLTGGAKALQAAFGTAYCNEYDLVLMLATYHKIKRIMPANALRDLMLHLGQKAAKYFAWRSTHQADELPDLDSVLGQAGLKRIHYSEISETIGAAAIWRRG